MPLELNLYSDYKKIYDDLMKFEIFNVDQSTSKEYQSIFTQWKNLKNKVDNL